MACTLGSACEFVEDTTDGRPIDGVGQSELLPGKSKAGRRESLLNFFGADLMSVRWKTSRTYFSDMVPGHSGGSTENMDGIGSAVLPLNGLQAVQHRIGPARGA